MRVRIAIMNKMKMKVINSKEFEILILVAIFLSILVAIMLDIKIFVLPNFFYMKNNNEHELINTLLTVQASTFSISIALIALLSGTIKESVYGISVSNYIMQEAPHIFKHNFIIISCLIIILLNFICVAMNFFNVSIDLFFVSILLLILLYKDVIKIFTEKDNTNILIEKFIICNYPTKKYLLNNFKNALIRSIETQNLFEIKNNYRLLIELFMCEVESETKENMKVLEEICAESYLIAFPQNNSRLNLVCLKNMLEIYTKVNNNVTMSEDPTPLLLWDKISFKFYRILSKTNLEDSFEENYITNLHMQLYKNMNFKLNEHFQMVRPINCLDLDLWSARIYSALFVNNCSDLLESKQHEIRVILFKNAENQMKYFRANSHDLERKEIAAKELALYTKILIEDLEEKVLEECFFNSYFFNSSNDSKLIPKVLIYLYYLGFREKFIFDNYDSYLSEKHQKFSEALLKKHQALISRYMYNNIEIISSELLNLKAQLESWEYYSNLRSKWIIMDHVIEDFIIWSIIVIIWDENKTYEILKSIMKGREFYYFNQYFGDL